jgi:signal transduction histidine kinase
MKIGFGFILLLLIHTSSFAKKTVAKPAEPQKSLQAAIDSENQVVYNIFLKSPDSARDIAEHALLLSEKIKYTHGIAQGYYNIGTIYWSQSYYPVALFYMNTALSNASKSDKMLLSDIYSGMGRVYADLGNYKKAMYNLDKCERYAGDDKTRLGEAYSEKSYVYLKLHNYDKALNAAKVSLKLNQDAGEFQGAAIIYSRLGSIYLAKNDYTRALAYDDTAYRNSAILKMNRLRAGMYLEYANLNNQFKKYDAAIGFAKKGVALYDSIGVMTGLANSYKAMIAAYEAKKDLKNALYYEKKYNHTEDSLNTVDKLKSTQLIQNYFALNARLNRMAEVEKKNEENKSKIEFQHTTINILVLSLVVVVVVLSVTYYYYEQKKLLSNKLKQQHVELSAQKALIETQAANLETVNKLKDKMMAVVGHDLRTPIANLHSILELFEGDYLTPEEVHVLMKDVSPIVKGTELTLSNLLDWAGSQIKGHSVDTSKIDMFLLGAEMEQTFRHLLKQKRLNFTNMAKPGQLVYADENHIKVILRNLMSNAIKFTGNEGKITLVTTTECDKLIISIEDTGMGMTAAQVEKLFSQDTHFSQSGTLGEKGTGLGLLLSNELIKLNGGELTVTSVPEEGSKFYFSLPLVK